MLIFHFHFHLWFSCRVLNLVFTYFYCQLLDLPGIIEGAKDGKGRGRQVSEQGLFNYSYLFPCINFGYSYLLVDSLSIYKVRTPSSILRANSLPYILVESFMLSIFFAPVAMLWAEIFPVLQE